MKLIIDVPEEFYETIKTTLSYRFNYLEEKVRQATPLQAELEEIKAETFKRAKRCDTQKDYDYGYHTAMTDIGDIIEDRIKELNNDL